MNDKDLITSLSKDFVKHTALIEKLKKENLEFYDLIQDLKGQLVEAKQDISVANKYIVKLEKESNEQGQIPKGKEEGETTRPNP